MYEIKLFQLANRQLKHQATGKVSLVIDRWQL